jgi:hemolysin III
MKRIYQSSQSLGEEIANSVLHGIGGLLGIAGLVILVRQAQSSLPAYVIFAGAMILMFFISSLYHALCPQGIKKIKEVFQIFDHQAIYIFIAGTYTPFCLLALKGPLGWALLCFEWVLAITGIILSALKCRFLKKAEMIIFILMGWAILAGCVPLARFLPLQSSILLLAGGIMYTAGTLFYRAGKEKCSANAKHSGEDFVEEENPRRILRKRVIGAHVVWHVFVLAGAACHWLSVWFFSRTA